MSGVLAFGDAADLGGVSAINRPLVAMAASPRAMPDEPSLGLPVNGTGLNDRPAPGDSGSGPLPATTTGPPFVGSPEFFSSSFEPSWGTSPTEDPSEVEGTKAGRVLAVAESGNVVFVAGEFAGVTAPGVSTKTATNDPTTILRRPYLVALDAATGALLDWDAQPNEAVLSLAVSPDGRRLYVGGRFRKIGGGAAGRIAALDVATGRLDRSFDPPLADSGVRAMALAGDTLYIGGNFTKVNGKPQPGFVKFRASG